MTTIELDDAMQSMCRLNPWSQSLFTGNITQVRPACLHVSVLRNQGGWV